MNPKTVSGYKLKSLLLNHRREILQQVAHLEAKDEELRQRFIEPIDDELLDEYRNLNDENSSIGRLKLPDDENLLNIEEV